MTVEEAIKTLERIVDDNEEFGKKVLSGSAIAGIKEGICAMEKQMPRIVYQKESQWTHRFYDCCPECGDRLRSDSEYHPNFCAFCGQSLKWGDEE